MSALPSGTTTATAKLIQRALNEKTGSTLGIDGSFGPQSIAALSVFQNQNGLPITGVYDAATQALLAPFIASKYLTLTSYQQAAQELGTDAATVETVCQVETSGAGFNNNGSCVILFERYQFYRTLLTVLPQATVNTIVAQNPNLCNTSGGGYQGGAAEWTRLQAAQAICTQYGVQPDLALRCASWGLFQIMGYYYMQCGFTNIEDFTNAMQVNESNQLEAFVNYVKDMNGGNMLHALVSHNWVSFATQYNGVNEHTQNNYDGKLAAAYQTLSTTSMF
jgi:peptidoglycan hydrolase-like protein with peptidoglycan-binding domain